MMPAVLLIGFNRPQMLSARIDNVLAFDPERLFISIDGPRSANGDDERDVRECREIAAAARHSRGIETRFLEENRGCRDAVSSAISWFLDEVGEGVIVEDDVELGPEFLPYAGRLLGRYRDSPEVGMISGFTPLDEPRPSSNVTYGYSLFGSEWGWATWADRWNSWRARGHQGPTKHRRTTELTEHRTRFLYRVVEQELFDSWAYPWELTRLERGWLTCTPVQRLTTNVGFGAGATHTRHNSATLHIPDSEGTEPGRFPPERLVLDLDFQDRLIRGLDRLHSRRSRWIPRRSRWKLIELYYGGRPWRRLNGPSV